MLETQNLFAQLTCLRPCVLELEMVHTVQFITKLLDVATLDGYSLENMLLKEL